MTPRNLSLETTLSDQSLSYKKLVRRAALLEKVGWSDSTLDRRIKDGTLKVPQHYTREPTGRFLFNPELILDGILNGFDSSSHLAACNHFLRSLPSNQPKPTGRPLKSLSMEA